MDYRDLLFNIKLLHENKELLYRNREEIRHDIVDNHTFDIYDIVNLDVIRYDIDCWKNGYRYGTPLSINFVKDSKEINIEQEFLNLSLDINEKYISDISFEEIDKIDNLEYTIMYGRIDTNKHIECGLSSLPKLLLKYIRDYE